MKKTKIISGLTILSGSLLSSAVMAQGGLGGIAENVKDEVTSFMSLALNLGFFAGAVLFIIGLLLIYKNNTQPGQNHLRNGVIACLVGVALLSAPTLVEKTSESAFSSDQTGGRMAY